MSAKPINARQHGIIDYIFSGIQLGLPYLLGLDRKTRTTYALLGSSFFLMNALTRTPVAIIPRIGFKAHQKADAFFLTGLAALSFAGFIRQKPAARAFHLAFPGNAIMHFILTDYNSEE